MNDFIHTIKNSLQARLSLALTAATLLLAAAAGGFSFYATYQETEELQDDLLRQTAAHISPASDHMAELPESDNDAHIFVQRPGSDSRFDIPAHLSDGFHNLTDDDDNYRAYLHRTDQGQIAVIQESEYREDLAENAAWRSTLPLLLSIPLSVVLTVWIAHRTMRPVKKLSRSLGQRQDNDLSPLATDDVPSEITGFVTAINRLLERTQENMRQQQRFIADAAHELRSP
ncbi:MAG: HAMP domain-containing protein, partial [Neisseria sp.]|uniref:HAMP domain-containing protein n=1 Tax=Neisseria sp. TaxID=192066 RepID=UPI00361B15FC